MEYIIFKLMYENYTIPLKKIKEILVYSQVIITELFSEDPWIKGMINLRGEVIPIVDLRVRFNSRRSSYQSYGYEKGVRWRKLYFYRSF